MEFKWLLLLPVYRYAYIGMIANAYAKEQNMEGVNYSVYEVVISTAFYMFVGAYLRYRNDYILYIAIGTVVLWILLRYLEHFAVFRLFTKHPLCWASVSWIPGVLLWRAVVAEKNL